MQIKGTGALVSGGASGLGEATARALAAKGAIVTIFDRDESRAKALADEIGGGHLVRGRRRRRPRSGRAGRSSRRRRARRCVSMSTAPASAGCSARSARKGEPHDFEAFKTVVSVNLVGHVQRHAPGGWRPCRRPSPLDDGERGVVVNTASVAAFEGQIGQISYSASKGGIVGMTLPAARDLSVVGIRVNTIAPGIMDTPLLGLLPEENRAGSRARRALPQAARQAGRVRRARASRSSTTAT